MFVVVRGVDSVGAHARLDAHGPPWRGIFFFANGCFFSRRGSGLAAWLGARFFGIGRVDIPGARADENRAQQVNEDHRS